jgi:hypothetical protein
MQHRRFIVATTWKEAEQEKKKKKKVKDDVKPFRIKNYNFFPCCYAKNIKSGFLYYLAIKNYKGINIIENNSPKFKSREEAEKFVESKVIGQYILG